MKKSRRFSYKLLFLVCVGVGFLFFTFIISSTIIGLGVQEQVSRASGYYSGDKVEVLIQVLDNPDKHSIKDRNSAIWALGQLGDNKALPILKRYQSNVDCSHNENLCQYEIKKAIKHIENGFNITRFIWKNSVRINVQK